MKIKRKIASIILSCMMAVSAAALSSCSAKNTSGTDSHTHMYVNGKCMICGQAEADDDSGNSGGNTTHTHSYGNGVVTTEATCDTAGEKTYTCTTCGATKTETIAALGHNYVNGVCSRCGKLESGRAEALDEDEANRNEAKETALAEAVAAYKEAAAAKVTEAAASATGTTLGATDLSTGWWAEFAGVTPTDSSSFDVTVTGKMFTDGAANWDSLLTIINSSAGVEFVVRMDNYGWVDESTNTAAYTQNGATYNWDTFIVDVNGADVSVNIKYDGTKVDILYTVKPLLAGETFTASKDIILADGTTETVTAEFTVPAEYTCSYTITGLSKADGVFPSFTVEKAYYIITDVTGGTLA